MNAITETGFALFDRLYQVFLDQRERRHSVQNALRYYYLEVRGNLELIDLLRDGALKGKPADDPGFLAFIGKLQTVIGASILVDNAGGKNPGAVFSRLQRESFGKLLADIAFTVLKVETLKTLCHCTPEEQSLFHGINLKTRIDNIEERLVNIQQSLSTIEGIKDLKPVNPRTPQG
jgi:hypothetical protein